MPSSLFRFLSTRHKKRDLSDRGMGRKETNTLSFFAFLPFRPMAPRHPSSTGTFPAWIKVNRKYCFSILVVLGTFIIFEAAINFLHIPSILVILTCVLINTRKQLYLMHLSRASGFQSWYYHLFSYLRSVSIQIKTKFCFSFMGIFFVFPGKG